MANTLGRVSVPPPQPSPASREREPAAARGSAYIRCTRSVSPSSSRSSSWATAALRVGRIALDRVGNEIVELTPVRQEAGVAQVLEHGDQRVPIARDVGEQDRLLVAAELGPGELLDELLDRADAARQCDERIGMLEHQPLALVHVGGDDDLVGITEQPFLRLQELRDDAGDLAAVVVHRARDRAHQAGRAAAVDEPNAVACEDFAELPGCGRVCGAVAQTRSAVDANSLDFAHCKSFGIAAAPASSRGRRWCRARVPCAAHICGFVAARQVNMRTKLPI